MNRIEFMKELSELLEDIPEEDRLDAINYYNDYFDDAGEENEQSVIEELESPKKVAAKIKGDQKEPEQKEEQEPERKEEQKEEPERKPWTSKTLKWILIIAIILVGCPILIPLAIGILIAAAGIVLAAFCIFIAIVIGFAAVVIAGGACVAAGIGSLFGNVGVGLAVAGAGMIALAVGAVGTVAGVRLCIIVFPGIIRGIVWILRKPFHRKAVA